MSFQTSLFLIGTFCLALASADKGSLPVLYRVDQPNSNVVVFSCLLGNLAALPLTSDGFLLVCPEQITIIFKHRKWLQHSKWHSFHGHNSFNPTLDVTSKQKSKVTQQQKIIDRLSCAVDWVTDN